MRGPAGELALPVVEEGLREDDEDRGLVGEKRGERRGEKGTREMKGAISFADIAFGAGGKGVRGGEEGAAGGGGRAEASSPRIAAMTEMSWRVLPARAGRRFEGTVRGVFTSKEEKRGEVRAAVGRAGLRRRHAPRPMSSARTQPQPASQGNRR